ncbi:hypothetical protein VPH49_24855 [Pseudomonas luteola]|uniref:hypothetical protein n=1 Tax=Pseudomonas luteola TaxID=47886 RepID=UPI00031C5976|nr:hypothetical protein [Pseudomonas luteola]
MSEQPKLPTLNEWFLSLEEGRQAVLREDKWMLAENAYQAGIEAERAARTAPDEPVAWANPKDLENDGYSHVFTVRSEQPANMPSVPLYTSLDALQAEVSKNKLLRAQLETVRLQRDKELKEKCEALNDVERLREEVERLKGQISMVKDVLSHIAKHAPESGVPVAMTASMHLGGLAQGALYLLEQGTATPEVKS